jgi:signal recognition particle subunit SRP19
MSSRRKLKQAARQEILESQPEIEYAPPDPNTKITWPRHLAGNIDDSKFFVLWPNNINSKKLLSQGRRISVAHACADPIVQEMSEVCQYLKLTHVIEPYKAVPRDILANPGRIRVQITSGGSLCHADIGSRKALMHKMGELIPKLNIRKHRLAIEQHELEAQKHLIESANSSKCNTKKKGKKGRR